jgi:hypothetical protein
VRRADQMHEGIGRRNLIGVGIDPQRIAENLSTVAGSLPSEPCLTSARMTCLRAWSAGIRREPM